jgi:hypothetical protein
MRMALAAPTHEERVGLIVQANEFRDKAGLTKERLQDSRATCTPAIWNVNKR